MVSCAHLSVALRVALGASTWPGKRGFTRRRSSPTQRRNGRAFSSLTARGGGLPIGVTWKKTGTRAVRAGDRLRVAVFGGIEVGPPGAKNRLSNMFDNPPYVLRIDTLCHEG